MKKFRIAVIVAAVLLIGLPPLFGMLTESQVHERVESLDAEGQLRVTVEEYDRGWFSSRALLSIAPPPAADPADPPIPVGTALAFLAEPMSVAVDFNHGPISVIDGFFLGFSEMHARPIAAPATSTSTSTSTTEPPFDFEFTAQSTFGGDLHFAARIMPFDAAADLFSASFSGGRINGTLAGERISARAEAEAFQYHRGAAILSVLGLEASADNELLSRFVMPGVITLRIDRVSLDLGTGPSSTIFDARGFDFGSSVQLDDARENLSGTARLALERVLVGSETEITRAHLETAAEQLDVAALEAYSAATQRAVEQGSSGLTVADEIEPAVLRLLSGGPALAVRTLRFDVNGEPFEASVQVAVDSAAMPPAGAVDLRDPALWTAVLDGRAEITAAKPLTQRIAVMIVKSQIGSRVMAGESMPGQSLDALAQAQAGLAIGILTSQGFIEDTGSLYRTELRVEDGQLTVNGRPLPLELP